MFNQQFLSSIKNRKHYSFFNEKAAFNIDGNFGWDDIIELVDSHPKEKRRLREEKLGFVLTEMEKRQSSPEFLKSIVADLKRTFHKNLITAHFFGGITNESLSFDIHRDTMDVLYLQVIGSIEWSVWTANDTSYYDNDKKKSINADEGRKIFSDTFRCGNMIWIPRGTYHLVEPYTSRLGVSFGVEGVDPSTYLIG